MKQDLLLELFSYSHGTLIWNTTNKIAGSRANDGYIGIQINNKKYQAHRLIWMYHYGKIPAGMEIDHKNRDRADNRIDNLRLVTVQENKFNRKGKGYTYIKSTSKYKSQIKINGKSINLGHFDTPEEASEAYLKAKKDLHPIKERLYEQNRQTN